MSIFSNLIMKKNELLRKVEEEKAFWINKAEWQPIGSARSLEELASHLKKAPLEAIAHHFNEQKNDFAVWVGEVIGDEILAKKLKSIEITEPEKAKKLLIRAFENRIRQLKRKPIKKPKRLEKTKRTKKKATKTKKKKAARKTTKRKKK